MFDGMTLALTLLVAAALGLILWARWQRRAQTPLAHAMALAALGLACGAAASPALTGPMLQLDLIGSDAWTRLAVTAFLGLAALWALLIWGASSRVAVASYLLACAGGALALSARDGMLCWVGAALFVAASKSSPRRSSPRPSPLTPSSLTPSPLAPSPRPSPKGRGSIYPQGVRGEGARVLGLGAMLYGLALLYYRAATLDLAALSRWLWAQGGPPDLVVLAGAALALGGLALMMGLLPPYTDDAVHGPLAPTLGLMLLARFCHSGFSALDEVWRGALIGMGAAAWAWGALGRAPAVMQRGFLLAALGLSARAEHWPGFWLALAAYALGQSVYDAVDRAADDAEQPLDGLLRAKPVLGAPLAVALASLAGLPPLLGLAGRARLLAAAWGEGWIWLAALGALASAWAAAHYWPIAAALARRPLRDAPLAIPTPLHMVFGLALAALALVALGLFPAPVVELARRMTG